MSYASEVLADSPVLYWRLGDAAGSTTAADSSGNSRPGTTGGGAANPTFGVAGAIADLDTAASFARASGQFVQRPNETALQITGNITCEAWINFGGTLPAAGFYPLMTKNLNSNETYAIDIRNDGANIFVRWHIQTGAFVNQANSFAWAINTWYHIVCTYDGANMKTYLNGSQLGTNTAQTGAIATTTDRFTVGSWGNGGDFFNGTIDEVALYGSALSLARIGAHYAAASAVFVGQAFQPRRMPLGV
jgi:hypothetical protein